LEILIVVILLLCMLSVTRIGTLLVFKTILLLDARIDVSYVISNPLLPQT
jgi:hypothetical protein